MQKALSKLDEVEVERFLRSLQWEIERKYFVKVEEGATAEIVRLQRKLRGAIAGKARKVAQAELVQAKKVLEAAKVKPIAGRLPVNHRYAGSWVPAERLPKKYRKQGLHFTEDGYPDFAPYARELPNGKRSVQIELTGARELDFAAADKAAGIAPGKRPAGYTWHHHQDGTTMELVPQELHEAVRHTGGAAHYRHVTGDESAYPR